VIWMVVLWRVPAQSFTLCLQQHQQRYGLVLWRWN